MELIPRVIKRRVPPVHAEMRGELGRGMASGVSEGAQAFWEQAKGKSEGSHIFLRPRGQMLWMRPAQGGGHATG